MKEILLKFRREIFSGFTFVFSGLLHQNSTFEEQEIWKISTDFGAECDCELSERTTHLISNRIDTEKALESLERGIPTVKSEWIYESCRRWERIDFNEFQLEIKGPGRSRIDKKRSIADLDESDALPLFLDEAELEEIQKELNDLEEEEEDFSEESDTSQGGQGLGYNEEVEFSEGELSDYLNCSTEEDDDAVAGN